MNEGDERFQKRLVIYQILATLGVSLGGIIIAIGISQIGFSGDLSMTFVNFGNDTDKQTKTVIADLIQNARDSGNNILNFGIIVIVTFTSLCLLVVFSENSKKRKTPKISKNPILFDEMYDGKDVELSNQGYDTHSVKKIRLTGEPLQYDYSVIQYAEKNKMILITRDSEVYGGCIENNIPCIQLGENPSVDEIIKELKLMNYKP